MTKASGTKGSAVLPVLALAPLAVVVLSLLAQRRIDRRDPEPACAPVDADCRTRVRRPSAAR